MRVVESGVHPDPSEWKTELACESFDAFDSQGCGAVLEVEVSDLVLRYFRGTHFRHDYPAVQCPECDKFTRVKNLPEYVLKQVFTPANLEAATFDGFSESIY